MKSLGPWSKLWGRWWSLQSLHATGRWRQLEGYFITLQYHHARTVSDVCEECCWPVTSPSYPTKAPSYQLVQHREESLMVSWLNDTIMARWALGLEIAPSVSRGGCQLAPLVDHRTFAASLRGPHCDLDPLELLHCFASRWSLSIVSRPAALIPTSIYTVPHDSVTATGSNAQQVNNDGSILQQEWRLENACRRECV